VSYLGAFALGLLLGRKVGARAVEVPPKLVFLPASSLEGADPSGVFIKTLVEAGVPQPLAQALYAELSSLPAVREVVKLWRTRERAYRILALANKALEEGRISVDVYHQIVRRYMSLLAEAERDAEKVEEEARSAVAEVLKHLSVAGTLPGLSSPPAEARQA
jgi:hypothetical protein